MTIVQPLDSTSPPKHAAPLAEAVRVLTAADRLSRTTSDGAGDEQREPVDWSESVSPALAPATASIGHIEAALTGRPGVSEAHADPTRSAFDSSDFIAVLAAKLTANGPDQRWTSVDVDGREGGAVLDI